VAKDLLELAMLIPIDSSSPAERGTQNDSLKFLFNNHKLFVVPGGPWFKDILVNRVFVILNLSFCHSELDSESISLADRLSAIRKPSVVKRHSMIRNGWMMAGMHFFLIY
jgi:hypothetical protein